MNDLAKEKGLSTKLLRGLGYGILLFIILCLCTLFCMVLEGVIYSEPVNISHDYFHLMYTFLSLFSISFCLGYEFVNHKIKYKLIFYLIYSALYLVTTGIIHIYDPLTSLFLFGVLLFSIFLREYAFRKWLNRDIENKRKAGLILILAELFGILALIYIASSSSPSSDAHRWIELFSVIRIPFLMIPEDVENLLCVSTWILFGLLPMGYAIKYKTSYRKLITTIALLPIGVLLLMLALLAL
ncbi:hypothetical protein M2101_002300 [Parabacteroides sp. PM5-20]|uniref:hypothetical protein n=1 Tax=unclassified Parabacteroides TaxID=2649774 RepID=UPI0013D1434E|nr:MULTISPECIES: hypothetical protein [unclassified Parabacteroides]MDH6535614.1 hypothetical protein [Parabacteroides sp. PM5-20]